MISKHLDKDNLHHAYLIEGERGAVVGEILEFVQSLKIETTGNADVSHISLDSFKIEDARNLRSYASEKGFSAGRKIFIISANNFLLEAQNSLLKMFEEPIENTHFFLVAPDANALLKTLVSRFYFISTRSDLATAEAEKFIKMPLQQRINFIKELLPKKDETDEEIDTESNGSKALKFLNALEVVIHKEFLKNCERCGSQPVLGEGLSRKNFSETLYDHFFKVRKFLRMPGSSPKTLMESVALIIPEYAK